jgi:hypothetical protein
VGILEKGLGKVLLVDEAYRLGHGQFAKEAIDELVDSLAKPQSIPGQNCCHSRWLWRKYE